MAFESGNFENNDLRQDFKGGLCLGVVQKSQWVDKANASHSSIDLAFSRSPLTLFTAAIEDVNRRASVTRRSTIKLLAPLEYHHIKRFSANTSAEDITSK